MNPPNVAKHWNVRPPKTPDLVRRAGFVAIVGPTNAGKSTMLNRLLGVKVSIVSPKAQTTWHGVRGILEDGDSQFIFTDTPGFQGHKEHVAKLLNDVADKNARDCEQQMWVFDATHRQVMRQFNALKERIASIGDASTRVVVLNKVDVMPKEDLLPLMAAFAESGLFREVIPVSGRSGDGLRPMVEALREKLLESPRLYEPNTVTDRPQSFRIAELVREKIYRYMQQEVPYSVWVEVEDVPAQHQTNTMPTFHVKIHVDSASKKGMLIGKGGSVMKQIGIAARRDIERVVGHQICLKLFVDVEEGWKDNQRRIDAYLELK